MITDHSAVGLPNIATTTSTYYYNNKEVCLLEIYHNSTIVVKRLLDDLQYQAPLAKDEVIPSEHTCWAPIAEQMLLCRTGCTVVDRTDVRCKSQFRAGMHNSISNVSASSFRSSAG